MEITKKIERVNINNNIYQNISELLQQAKKNVNKVINSAMVNTYFEIGRMIVQEEQEGKKRAEYGKKLLEALSKKLTLEFGKGFSERNLKQMRMFYQKYSIGQTVSAQFKLSWSHYIFLCKIDNLEERNFYEIMVVVFVKQFMEKLKQFFEHQNIPLQVFHNLENYVLYRYCKS